MIRKKYKKRGPSITVWKNAEAASVAAAHFFTMSCQQSIAEHGKFVIALAGGNTPKNLYGLLASEEYSRNIPWKKVFIFLTDERYVPLTDKESNYRMLNENLLTLIPIPGKNIFPILYKKSAAESAALYEQKIKIFFGNNRLRFDLMLLGVGNDGHTASLFPHTPVLKEKKCLVKEVWVEEKNTWRSSLTLPLINSTKQVLFLVTGKEKASIVKTIFSDNRDDEILPVELVNPKTGDITWIIDENAASLLRV